MRLLYKQYIGIFLAVFGFPLFALAAIAQPQPENPKTDELKVIEAPNPAVMEKALEKAPATTESSPYIFDPLKYTLGPNDAVEITVMRHPEFSGVYPINEEGKLQYKFVGDIDITGLTKFQLEQKIKEIISAFVISPEVNVTITEFRSKVIYVIGDVGTPGKYYIRSEAIPVREAVFQAGLPTPSAALRKCQIITPDKSGKPKIRHVDLYSLLYIGNLKKNIDMHPGDVLYIPSTVMAKIIRVINPVASTIGVASSGPSSASSGKASMEALAK